MGDVDFSGMYYAFFVGIAVIVGFVLSLILWSILTLLSIVMPTWTVFAIVGACAGVGAILGYLDSRGLLLKLLGKQ